MKKILAVLLSTSIMLGAAANPAMARDHDRNDQHNNNWNSRSYHNNYAYNNHDRDRHRGGHDNGWGIAALAILGGAAVIAATNDSPQPVYVHQPVYVQQQPVYVQQQPVYVQRQPVYVPRVIEHTYYEPHTVYRTVYEPSYAEAW